LLGNLIASQELAGFAPYSTSSVQHRTIRPLGDPSKMARFWLCAQVDGTCGNANRFYSLMRSRLLAPFSMDDQSPLMQIRPRGAPYEPNAKVTPYAAWLMAAPCNKALGHRRAYFGKIGGHGNHSHLANIGAGELARAMKIHPWPMPKADSQNCVTITSSAKARTGSQPSGNVVL